MTEERLQLLELRAKDDDLPNTWLVAGFKEAVAEIRRLRSAPAQSVKYDVAEMSRQEFDAACSAPAQPEPPAIERLQASVDRWMQIAQEVGCTECSPTYTELQGENKRLMASWSTFERLQGELAQVREALQAAEEYHWVSCCAGGPLKPWKDCEDGFCRTVNAALSSTASSSAWLIQHDREVAWQAGDVGRDMLEFVRAVLVNSADTDLTQWASLLIARADALAGEKLQQGGSK
jgi:hypothetical protein